MKFLSAASVAASIFYLYVGVSTYKLNKKSKECRIFLLLNISMAIWAFTYSFAYTAENHYVFSFWNKLAALGWCTFSALILYLCLIITNSKLLSYKITSVIIFLPAFIFLYMSIFLFGPNIHTNAFISSFFYIGNFIYNFSYLLLSILALYFWGRSSKLINEKKQSRVIVITSIIPFLLNLLTQSILPHFGAAFIPNMGQLYSLIMLLGVYYSIKNYQFMKIPSSLITEELFNEIMDLTFLVDVNGKVLRINRQVHELLNYSENELINTPITNIINEETFISTINNSLSITEVVKINAINISSKAGATIPCNITISPLKDSKRQAVIGFLIVGQDIRLIKSLQAEIVNHKKTSEKLKKSEELFRTIIEIMPFGIVLTSSRDNTVIYINSKMEELFRLERREVIGESVIDYYFSPNDRVNLIQYVKEGKTVKEEEVSFKRRDNSVISGLLTMVKTVYNDEDVILACLSDITEQRKLQQNVIKSEEMLKKLMNSIPDLVTVTDLNGNITFFNQSVNILGYNPEDELLPKNVVSVIGKADIDKAKANMEKMLKSELGPVEYTHNKKDGSTIDVEVNGTALREETGEPFGMIFVTRDITERKKYQENLRKSKEEIEKINSELLKLNSLLEQKSIHDSLTNLYNHQHINELLDIEISNCANKGNDLCLMMMDIDFFKRVNDNFGHQIGDGVLVALSNLIKCTVRNCDLVGRYGGEEFIVILPQISLEEAYKLAEKIRLSVENYDFKLDSHKVTVSIGLAQYTFENAKAFVNKADTLLYQAKRNGRNRIEKNLCE